MANIVTCSKCGKVAGSGQHCAYCTPHLIHVTRKGKTIALVRRDPISGTIDFDGMRGDMKEALAESFRSGGLWRRAGQFQVKGRIYDWKRTDNGYSR